MLIAHGVAAVMSVPSVQQLSADAELLPLGQPAVMDGVASHNSPDVSAAAAPQTVSAHSRDRGLGAPLAVIPESPSVVAERLPSATDDAINVAVSMVAVCERGRVARLLLGLQ